MSRKGDYIAIERRSSYTSLKTGTHQNWDWYIGKVTSATRDGVVKSAEFYGQNEGFPVWTQQAKLYDRGSWWRAYSISDEYQSAAAQLVGREFSNAEDMKTEIKATAAVHRFFVQSVGATDVSTISEYGLAQKLSASVRCF